MSFQDWIKAARPRHWIKSGFCFSAVFFSGNAADFAAWWQVVPLAVAFSVLASAGYLLNDTLNRGEDRFHPRKKKRPVASGRISPRAALLGADILALLGMGLVFGVYGWGKVLVVTACYVAVTVSYSLFIRKVPVIDVMVLACGFVLRVIGGAYALGALYPEVRPTVWLVVCPYCLALLLGFGKRRAELVVVKGAGGRIGVTRESLAGYSPRMLEVLVGISALLSGAFYVSYCVTRDRPLFFITAIPVIVGLMSYMRMAVRSPELESPENLILHNSILFGCVGTWLLLVAVV